MLRRLTALFRRSSPDTASENPAIPRDYAQEREDRRVAQMSDEDKAWGAASQQRDRENKDREQETPVS